MKNTCILRGLDTKNGDHGSAAVTMMRGRRNEAAIKYPDLGAVLAREMGRADSKVPDYVTFYTQTEGRGFAPGDIYLSAERNMKCATGHCGHCQMGPLFVCKDGPVFSVAELGADLRREGL
jgi:hypothetical protein